MLAKELARVLGGIFRLELDGLLVDTERGVRRIERDYERDLLAEFGEDIRKPDADRIRAGFRQACRNAMVEVLVEHHGLRERMMAMMATMADEEMPVAATMAPQRKQ